MESTSSQSKTRGRLKLAGLVVCLLIAVMCSVGWVLTWRGGFMLKYSEGDCAEPGAPGGHLVYWTCRDRSVSLCSSGGLLFLSRNEGSSLVPSSALDSWKKTLGWHAHAVPAQPPWEYWWRFQSSSNFSFIGFGRFSSGGPGAKTLALFIPYWFIMASVTIPWFAAAWQARRRRNRRGARACERCNYNLAGLEPGSPCPECGSGPPRT